MSMNDKTAAKAARQAPEAQEPIAAQVAPQAAAPQVADVFPDFAVSLEEADKRVRQLQEYVRDHMVEGEDYGVIPGTSKPTLFKPGAEKLNAIFGLAPIVQVINRHEDWERGFVAYETKVQLINKRTGEIEAEGIGLCNSQERRYKNQDAPSIANTILKISKKRALVDATLSATRASGMFTQDLEDMDLDLGGNAQLVRAAAPSPQSTSSSSGGLRFERPQQRSERTATQASSDGDTPNLIGGLTEAQYRAIMGIGTKVFGRQTLPEEWEGVMDKPVEELSKAEASEVIDRLRTLQAGQASSPQGSREPALHRSSRDTRSG